MRERKMAERADRIEERVVIKAVSGDKYTPYSLAKKLGAKVLLESSSFEKGKERFSILMIEEAFRLEQRESEVFFIREGKEKRIKSGAKDILDVLGYFADQHKPLGLELPFPAGGMGFLSYEFARFCDTVVFRKKEDPLPLPDACFLFGHLYVIFDHYTDILYLVALDYAEARTDLEALVERTERTLRNLDFTYLEEPEKGYAAEVSDNEDERRRYIDGVEQVRQRIIAGDILQGVLSRRVTLRTTIPPLEAYRHLRGANPSPYLFFLDFGGYVLFGSSPEVHVKVKDGVAEIHPIAGTRRRGRTDEEDRALEKELKEDEKERAEHLMLVDLARNDLGRVCLPGTVEVASFMEVERYSHVMHLVSRVRGTLENRSCAGVIRATFPAGTVSGAPKLKAMEIIDSLEADRRGFYAGLVGYFEPGGQMDTCITIRSALQIGDTITLQAGAGIVYDSTPEREYEETGEKLMALLSAIEAGV
jgi:anthranilate synthase component I